jgi:hypothetical protein
MSLESGWLTTIEGRIDIHYCTDEDVQKKGRLSIQPEGTSDSSETDYQLGSIVITRGGMSYFTKPGGIDTILISFEVSAF